MEKQEEDRQTTDSSSGQWIGLCVCVCVFICMLKPAHVYVQHVLTHLEMCSPGHCSTFRSNGGVTQIGFPGQEGELAVSWRGRIAVSARPG